MSERSMSASFMAAMAAMSLFCSLLSFLISSPLTWRRGAGRYDSHDFFAILLKACMHDKEHYAQTDRPQSDPALLFACRFITLRQSPGIVEYSAAVSNRTSCFTRFRWFFAASHSKRMAVIEQKISGYGPT